MCPKRSAPGTTTIHTGDAKVSGDLDSDFTFTGHYYHSVSGLDLTLYRAYDANTGRWMSRDPLAEGAGLNLYAYCGNDPINNLDPLGLSWRTAWHGFAGAVIGGAV